MALAHLTINLDDFTGDDHPPISQYSTITLDPGADHIDAAADVIHVRTIVVSLDQQGKAATANGVPCVDGKVPVVAGVMYAVLAPNVLRDGPHYIPALTAGQVVDLSDYITPGAPLTPDQAAILTARIKALEAAPPGAGVTDHGALTGLGDDDHGLYALADGTRGAFAAPLGADDNYVTDAEKAALHAHSNKAALDLVSGTNTGDQVLPTWSTISGKPAVVAEGVDAAAARTALSLGDAATKNTGTTAGTLAAGDDSRIGKIGGTVTITGTPTAGQVPIASSGTAAAWGTPAGGGGSSAQVDVYTATGAAGSQSSYTWTKPAGAVSVTFVVVSAGGGGGSGRRGATSTERGGGGGGGGGAWAELSMPASAVAATLAVNVGKGGAGGAAVTTNDTNGNAGGAGGASSIANMWSLAGGGGGGAGTAAAGAGGAGSPSNMLPLSSGNGGAGGGGAGSATNGLVPMGGGGGGSVSAANGGQDGGRTGAMFGGAVVDINGGVAWGGNGGAGVSRGLIGSGGGGGATANAGTGTTGSGGVGAPYGGGGGGGAGSTNGSNSGAGGAGADGIVIITTTF